MAKGKWVKMVGVCPQVKMLTVGKIIRKVNGSRGAKGNCVLQNE